MALNWAELLLYGKTLGGGAPASAASPTGDISAMVKHAVEELAKISGATNIAPTADANGSIAERVAYLQGQVVARAGIVQNARDWGGGAGYEFWLGPPNADTSAAAAATNPSGLDGWGWSVAATMGTAAESLTNLIGTPPTVGGTVWSTTATPVAFSSPTIFGGYAGFEMAARFLGQMPTKLVLEYLGRFANGSANIVQTWLPGMTAPGTTDASATGSGGAIVSDGSNFRLRSGGGGNLAGPAIDTNWHKMKLIWDATNVTWEMDGATIGTVFTPFNIWPCSMSSRRDNVSGTNIPRFTNLRAYYEI